jgi:hypothetical protein
MDRSVPPLAQRILSERIPVLRFPGNRPRADKSRDAELRSVSTRAVITSTSFTNHYEWGDLKADPLKLLEKYFDTFLYVANWGTRELYLRLPRELGDYKVLRAQLPGEPAQVRKSGNSVIVAFENQFEDDDWDDGTGRMGSLMHKG